MPKYYKKTTLGIFQETDPWDPDVIEVRLSIDEFRNYQAQIQDQKRETDRIKQDHQSELMRIREEAERERKELEQKIQINEDDYEMEFDAMGQEIDRLTNHLREAQGLNENLKRICRERKNAERGVRPKKEHPGFLVVNSQQIQRRIRKENPYEEWKKDNTTGQKKDFRPYEMIPLTLWKTTIETFYDVEIPIETLREEIWTDLDRLLKSWGTDRIEHNQIDISIDDVDKMCIVFNPNFRGNYRNGLWEVELMSTQQLNVPSKFQKRNYR